MSTSGLTQTGAVSSLKAWKYGSAVPALVTFREEAGQRSSLLLDRPRRDAGYTGVVEFEWDPKKAGENLKKHGVEFVEAATVFADPLSITVRDPDHSETENRLIIVGYSNRSRPLAVSISIATVE